MGWLAFLSGVAFVCLGYALGVYFSQRSGQRAAAKATTEGPAAPEAGQPLPSELASVFLERIRQVTAHVDSDVGRHATRVAEISGGLTEEMSTGSAAVLNAAAKLLESNRLLQQDLARANEEIQHQRRQLDSYMAEALTDQLTGLANRRKFDQELERRFSQWRRNGGPLTLLLIDVDRFKQFNDEFGHQAGDAVLEEVSRILDEGIRKADLVARYGGEEFAIILPGTTHIEAERVAERLRNAVEHQRIGWHGDELHVTVSVGIAQAMPTNDSGVLVSRADAALYAAKQAGRNCCHTHDGQRCRPVERVVWNGHKRNEHRQRIAPFIDGTFPEPGMFREIDCEDISVQGFTYLVHERPDYDKVLMALGEIGERNYTTASVQECRNIGAEADPLFRVACRFTSPVDRFADALAG